MFWHYLKASVLSEVAWCLGFVALFVIGAAAGALWQLIEKGPEKKDEEKKLRAEK